MIDIDVQCTVMLYNGPPTTFSDVHQSSGVVVLSDRKGSKADLVLTHDDYVNLEFLTVSFQVNKWNRCLWFEFLKVRSSS